MMENQNTILEKFDSSVDSFEILLLHLGLGLNTAAEVLQLDPELHLPAVLFYQSIEVRLQLVRGGGSSRVF